MKALIDADSLLYRVGFAAEDDEEWVAKARLDETLEMLIFQELEKCDEYQCFTSGSTNFRNEVAVTVPYKGNRAEMKRPKHLQALKKHIVKKWKATVSEDKEADDDVCIAAHEEPHCIIAHIDKDLDQIPGSHYNYVKKQFYNIGKFEGLKNLYTQALVGDVADNIKGVKGIGKVKAAKILKDCFTEEQLYKTVLECYTNSNKTVEQLHENMKLLYLLRSHDDEWRAPE
jgi:5'-3' exonuclease